MELTIQKILEDYWSQILLLLTGLGIVMRLIFDFLLKKKEINHGIFQKNRMDALIRFYSVYAEVKSMWVKLPIFQIYRDELTSDEIDKRIQPPLNKLEASIIELQIYFKEALYDKFKEIEKNMFKMNRHFLDRAFEIDSKISLTQRTNNYIIFREKIEKENSRLLAVINKEISKKY
ncbi:MAG: hypothetical protein APF83_05235 [Lutibacter sp. BRH_c52]|nr:MAG: hypothetical protein APF83_05235 [Lutibacter sp. BRH_c52]